MCAEAGRILMSAQTPEELDQLRKLGASAQGEVVDHDPLARVRELLGGSQFDAVIVCTLPTKLSHWLRVDLPGRLARATKVPVLHVPGTAGPSL